MRPFIVLGDKTDHGGTVVSGAPTSITGGKPIARINDQIICPRPDCVVRGMGSNHIVSGDRTVIIDGQPVARHGDKTACGAMLISSQIPTASGGSGQSSNGNADAAAPSHSGSSNAKAQKPNATPPPKKAPAEPNADDDKPGEPVGQDDKKSSPPDAETALKYNGYRYLDTEENYYVRQAAYMPAEGVGVNGSYFLKGSVSVKAGVLTVTSSGNTAAQNLGDVTFFASIEVHRNGALVEKVPVKRDGPAMWPDDEFTPIGSATANLPTPESSNDNLTVEVIGGYTFSNSTGGGVPVPGTTQKTFDIRAVEKK